MSTFNHTLLSPSSNRVTVAESITPERLPDKVATQQREVTVRETPIYGVIIAISIISLWATSLIVLLTINVTAMPVWGILLAVLWQMFLYTGLFITAHDAMHGSVWYHHPRINSLIGTIAVLCYGLFSYQKLLHKHWMHHRYPASDRDPDFHDGTRKNPIAWYFHFMRGYWDWRQLIGFSILFYLAVFLQVHQINLALFWILPSILSSIQLFYFGTFMPHREPTTGHTNSHRAQTNALPAFWSFITCYHFGYHEEHHEYPHVPWWQLPAIHNAQRSPKR